MSEQTTSPDTQAQPESQELSAKKTLPLIHIGEAGIRLANYEDLVRFSKVVFDSGLAPYGFKSVQAVMIGIQMALETGWSPLTGLQGIAVINGKPTFYGDHQLAMVRSSGMMQQFSEWFEAKGVKLNRTPQDFTDDVCAVARCVRNGEEHFSSFSVADAKRGKLWGKTGNNGQDTPWITHPQRMLRFRARAFLLRDVFGDVLKGMRSAEEVGDDPVVTRDVSPLAPRVHILPDERSAGAGAKRELAPILSGEDLPQAMAKPRPRGGKAKPETEPVANPIEDDKPKSEDLQTLERLMKERGLLESEILQSANMSKMPGVGKTLAQTSPETLQAIIEMIDGFVEHIEKMVRKQK